ncbi:hypothetical protein PV11_06679 [Exophiala sideris]|uniref:Zn(2)-C6 fungal-type domain-containing protein n=1 Tax=Exophiala sideris TaxID=1016849 RepID=A0A0D1YW88_9EURO|nr:hypothetical protein PV11_06679 [Exophiala sideris]
MAAMVTTSPRDPTEVKFRRTNSLAFAKSDCHTCSSLSLHCDRQRPRCTPCQNAGILCQGYSMKLTWHQNHSMVNRPPKVKSVPIQPQESNDVPRKGSIVKGNPSQIDKSPGSPSTSEQSRQFMFVAARPPKRRKKSHQVTDSGATNETPRRRASSKTAIAGPTVDRPTQTPASEAARRPSNVTVADTPLTDIVSDEPIQIPPLLDVADFNLDPALKDSPTESIPWQQGEFNWFSPPCQQPSEMIDFESLEQCLEIQRQPLPMDLSHPSPPSTHMSMSLDLPRDLWPEEWTEESPGDGQDLVMQDKNFVDMIPQLCYSTLTDKFYGLLDMYDQEFCRYPITNHFAVNPYRYRPETTRGSQHLLHAIVALSCHFRLRSATQPQPPADAVDHKNTAVVLYQGALSKKDIHLHGLSMLDTAMALWQFEATISALNIWRSHLSDAHSLLELCGGVSRWSASIKANTQVSMFLWWDAMVSLLAREDPVFPYSYFEAVLKSEGRQPWTFYELNGCPRELLVPMMQISTLAARDAKSTTPTETDSISGIVTEIELSIRQYEYSGAGLSDLVFEGIDTDENDLHIERDRYHCCEAFRYALLIYILRVFTMRRVLALDDDSERERERKRVRSRLSFLARIALEHVAACRPDDHIQKQVLFPLFLAGAETRHLAHRDIVREYCARWYGEFGYQMFKTVGDVLEVVWQRQDAGDEIYWWGQELDARRAVEGDYVQFCFG